MEIQVKRTMRKGLMVLFDLSAISAATIIAYHFLYPVEFVEVLDGIRLIETTAMYGLLFFTMALTSDLYRVAWRFASIDETVRLIATLSASTVLLYAFQFLLFQEAMERMLFLSYCLSLLLLLGARLGTRVAITVQRNGKELVQRTKGAESSKKRTLIIGAGQAGQMLVRQMRMSNGHGMNPIAFLDDNASFWGLKIKGIPVRGKLSDLERIVQARHVERVVIAIPSLPFTKRAELIKRAKNVCSDVHTLPMIEELAAGKVSVNSVREVSIEDLLGREPVELDISGIRSEVNGKTVLVTGAGGSIGSEICRQIAKFEPNRLILLGHGENSIYLIERELRVSGVGAELIPIIADIQDRERLEEVFSTYRPQLVFHAAAHKHVPLMEANPQEAVKNNIFGTKNVAETADRFGVSRFVMISTDKAVNPTNVMGSTKRIAEMVVQGLAKRSTTKYAIVRFGNVLGSRGSVIPLFKSQIERGGPVTVTHPEMTRYFMTIPEASRLVIQAGMLADGGEVFVLDMGEPVKIVDLAKNMIRLSGFTEEQMSIAFTGIRPGEKMFEELLKEGEVHPEAIYPKIFVGIVTEEDELEGKLDKMMRLEDETTLARYLVDWANDRLDSVTVRQ